jgi:hypothetical protein
MLKCSVQPMVCTCMHLPIRRCRSTETDTRKESSKQASRGIVVVLVEYEYHRQEALIICNARLSRGPLIRTC